MKTEIIFFIIVAIFLGSYLFGKYPRYKYKRALKLIADSQYEKAISILQNIFYKIPEAPSKIAECKLKLGSAENLELTLARKYFYEILDIKSQLNNKSNKELYDVLERKAIFELHQLKFKEIIQNKSLKENEKITEIKNNLDSIKEIASGFSDVDYSDLINTHRKKITDLYYDIVVMKSVDATCLKRGKNLDAIKVFEENISFIDNLTDDDKFFKQNLFKTIREKQILELFDYYFQIGLSYERESKFNDAIDYYCRAKLYLVRYKLSAQVLNDIVTRIEICKLKNGSSPDEAIFYLISDSNINYRNDFFYRLAVRKIEEKNYNYSEKLIESNFNDNESSDIKKLLSIIKKNKIAILHSKKERLNKELEILIQANFPISDTELFYSNLMSLIEETNSILPALADKLIGLKPSIFNRLLTTYIENKRYNEAIELILNYPNFFENTELIKNLAICCFGVTSHNLLNENNFKTIISSWLTAIHIDKVILSSIEKMSWDDEYTFTLVESLSANMNDVYEELPQNVNFEEPSVSNISIGATQKELLLYYEEILNSISDNISFVNIHDFYDHEKKAVQNLISANPNSQFHPAPYFGKLININENIIQELNNSYDDNLDVRILEAGIPYLSDNSGSYVRNYADAKSLIKETIDSINRLNLSNLKNMFNDSSKQKIYNYYNLPEKLENLIFDVLREKIEEDSENEEIVKIMEYLIYFMNDNDKLMYQYSNFVLTICIKKVNEGRMSNFQALKYIFNVFLYNPENFKICDSLTTLINFNLNDILNKKNIPEREIYGILDEIYENRGITFIKSAREELLPTRSKLLDSLKKSGVDISIFEKNNYNNTLTKDGERMRIILYYLKKLSIQVINS